MSDVLLKICSGKYDNSDAYARVLQYVANKTYINGYGFYLKKDFPITEQFSFCETMSKYDSPRKLWHFILSFKGKWTHTELLSIGNRVSLLFAPDYQVFYGLDLDGTCPHFHFVINAYSYHSGHPPLDCVIMQNHILSIENYFRQNFTPLSFRFISEEE